MPEVLRSIGFDPAVADGEFLARCQAALDFVQRDLDVTGWPVPGAGNPRIGVAGGGVRGFA
jgi:hypothetical protein